VGVLRAYTPALHKHQLKLLNIGRDHRIIINLWSSGRLETIPMTSKLLFPCVLSKSRSGAKANSSYRRTSISPLPRFRLYIASTAGTRCFRSISLSTIGPCSMFFLIPSILNILVPVVDFLVKRWDCYCCTRSS
jgi:hypothetical protein